MHNDRGALTERAPEPALRGALVEGAGAANEVEPGREPRPNGDGVNAANGTGPRRGGPADAIIDTAGPSSGLLPGVALPCAFFGFDWAVMKLALRSRSSLSSTSSWASYS